MKIHLLLSLLFLCFLFPGNIIAQEEGEYVPGEMIIQLKPGINIEKFVQAENAVKIVPVKCLVPRMNIWLVSFQDGQKTNREVLSIFQASKDVLAAQFNHYIGLRETIPDDPQFEDQWALKNTQQSAGVEDADIDATDAWDITTGGLTATGDTIVVAIVDDGFDLTHEDLNFWKNYHEIPDNGIDDDTNGYVDDYDGWNSRFSNGNIVSQDHGTHVTGIAGAVGNNGKGVSGVNWGVKTLAVLGSSVLEAPVVEAYGYIYEIRTTYDETNGAKGAFVVATNASFGVNMGQPEDYPIWGSMYDSLGQIGILSTGATANNNWNIDEVGDIPTAFPSEYLISVTNTTQYDVKNSSAAYGLETIDLGAPGTGVLSTRWFNNYGLKTGTSMSAPHVTGAIALVMAAGNEGFINAYKENPSGLSILVKDYIFEGVDELPDLEGITVTGGRLNVYNSVVFMSQPALGVNPDNFSLSLMQNKQDSSTFGIRNIGPVDMDYLVDNASLPDWIEVNPDSGNLAPNETDSLQIYYEPSMLNPGLHATNIKISSFKGEEYFVEVELQVLPVSIIEEANKAHDLLTCYPVPFTNILNVQVHNPEYQHVSLVVHDLSGRIIKQLYNGLQMEGEYNLTWDGSDFQGNEMPNGVYICRLITSEGSLSSKVILNR